MTAIPHGSPPVPEPRRHDRPPRARAIAASSAFTNVQPASTGASAGPCVPMKDGMPKALQPPQPPLPRTECGRRQRRRRAQHREPRCPRPSPPRLSPRAEASASTTMSGQSTSIIVTDDAAERVPPAAASLVRLQSEIGRCAGGDRLFDSLGIVTCRRQCRHDARAWAADGAGVGGRWQGDTRRAAWPVGTVPLPPVLCPASHPLPPPSTPLTGALRRAARRSARSSQSRTPMMDSAACRPRAHTADRPS